MNKITNKLTESVKSVLNPVTLKEDAQRENDLENLLTDAGILIREMLERSVPSDTALAHRGRALIKDIQEIGCSVTSPKAEAAVTEANDDGTFNARVSTVTVGELIGDLEMYDRNAKVLLANDYGDIGHTVQTLPVDSVVESRVRETGYSRSRLALPHDGPATEVGDDSDDVLSTETFVVITT